MIRPPRSRPRGESGQATVELAAVLPLLLGLVLVTLQVGLVVRDQVLLVQVTREAARARAVEAGAALPPPAPGGLDPARLELDVSESDGMVRVDGRYRSPVVVPLLSSILDEVTLHAALSMRAEWP